MPGLFAIWQPRYAERGVAVFPVLGKIPAVRNFLRIGCNASAQFARRFGNVDGLGFACGTRSGISIVDVDTSDERVVADAIHRHGSTPVIARTGSGNFHLYYRHGGERRDTASWRKRGLPIDILGSGGFAVGPPSRGSVGHYEFVQGGLDDLPRLPNLKGLAGPLEPSAGGSECLSKARPSPSGQANSGRNNALFIRCMTMAKGCDSVDRLFELATVENVKFEIPLSRQEVARLVNSAWKYESRGLNWVTERCPMPVVPLSFADIDGLMAKSPDAFLLLSIIRRHNFNRDHFCVANAMATTMPPHGWARKRFAVARSILEIEGRIVLLRSSSIATGAAVYGWGSEKGGQI